MNYVADPLENRLENIKANMKRGLATVHVRPPHEGVFAICAGGPSLKDEIGKIKSLQREGAKIVAVNGVYNYLLKNKVIPDIFVMADTKKGNSRFVSNPKQETIYMIAADCHPDVFDALSDRDVRMWIPIEYNIPAPTKIGGGSTVTLRALTLGYIFGFRKFHLFGFDGSIKDSHHAYPQEENDGEEVVDVNFHGKLYKMTNWMIAQAEDFDKYLRAYGDYFDLNIHTKGVMKDIQQHIGENNAS